VIPLPFSMERTIPATTLPILHAISQHTLDSLREDFASLHGASALNWCFV
jgi:hypothetical protein